MPFALLLPHLRPALRSVRPGALYRYSTSTKVPLLIEPQALASLLKSDKPPIVIDASWHMPNLDPPRNAFDEFKAKRILGATFWDVDIIATKPSKSELEAGALALPHMLPSPARFADAASRLGIEPDAHIVVYDSVGVFSAPRAAWTFKAFSHPGPVQILSGGLPAWSRASLPVDTSAPAPINPHSSDEPKQPTWGPIFAELLYSKRPKIESYFIADVEAHFGDYPEPTLRKDQAVRSYEEIVENNRKGEDDSSREVVLDARPAGRFHGTSPEPRASLSSGHMPQALSLPSSALVEDGTLLPAAKLEQVFLSALGGDKELWEAIKSGERRVTATCGSGMTAAILWAALEVVREATGAASEIAIYDESWTGYASRDSSEIVKSS